MEGLPVVPYEELAQAFPAERNRAFCPAADNKLRARIYLDLKAKGYEVIKYVSSRATVLSEVGENCFVLEDNTIQPYVKVGNNVIFWSGNHIGHHSEIKDHVFFASHVVLSGNCVVESYAWLGVNCTIKHGTRIGEGSVVGMASAVLKDTEPWCTYVGVPARRVETNGKLP
jgi:sugar O-acyltransferase (sialic acid O-acetyltransferase NeuD family)